MPQRFTRQPGGRLQSMLIRAWWLTCTGLIGAESAATAPQLDGARKAVLMLILLAVVLGAFLLVAIAVVLVRRIRRRETPPRRPEALVDPWSEAGRRVEPYHDERS